MATLSLTFLALFASSSFASVHFLRPRQTSSAIASTDFSGLASSCASVCYTQYVPQSGCSMEDIKCICANKNLLQVIAQCAYSTCSDDNDLAGYQESARALSRLCNQNGVALDTAGIAAAATGTSRISLSAPVSALAATRTEEASATAVSQGQVVTSEFVSVITSTGTYTGTVVTTIGNDASIIGSSLVSLQTIFSTISGDNGQDVTSESVTYVSGVAAVTLYTSEMTIGGDEPSATQSPDSEEGYGETTIGGSGDGDGATIGYSYSTISDSSKIYSYTGSPVSYSAPVIKTASSYIASTAAYTQKTMQTASATTPVSYSGTTTGNNSYMGVTPFVGAAAKGALSWKTIRAAVGLGFTVMIGGLMAL